MPDDVTKRDLLAVQPGSVDYAMLAEENARRYGTEWPRIGGMLLADRYAERTHFIYELLQNAEDALRKRTGWDGQRSIKFELSETSLRVSHFGKPFEEADVRGICGISESTKDLTAIGRFGIGFKSVYAFTDRPEVHSGSEDFTIEDYIRPVAADPVDRQSDETVILIPLRSPEDLTIIATGLASLGANALLFLREIDQIEWTVQGGASGLYLRDQSADQDGGVRQVKVIGEQAGQPEIEEDWLLFARQVGRPGGGRVGYVELAFALDIDEPTGRRRIRRVTRSMLNVFFPTVVETHLGFLLQGPLRTTPSRDAVPSADDWNASCVQAAAELLTESLRWLRDHQMLDVAALNSLPLDRSKFEGGMFAPLYEQVKASLSNELLLPDHRKGYLSARQALLARGQDLRELLDESQLGELFPEAAGRGWLTGAITQDRAPELRQYLLRELGIQEVAPDTALSRLTAEFLEQQTDAWIEHLYVFLGGQPALRAAATRVPLVRRADGSHVRPHVQGVPQVYLVGNFKSGFPTVRSEVCRNPEAASFLSLLGLTAPDRVDDVLRNVTPKYRQSGTTVTLADYAADMARIVAASKTDSRNQREKLVADLTITPFVLSLPTTSGPPVLAQPANTVLPTDRLKELLADTLGELIVDDRQACLRGQDVRDLLETCGTTRHLRLITAPEIDWQTKHALREKAGHADTSGQNDRVNDLTLSRLNEIIAKFGTLDVESRRRQAEFLWEELALIEDRRGKGVFTAEYRWTHYGSYLASFPATFTRMLNETPWVPGPNGELYPPGAVLFEPLGWKPYPFLLTQIRFKPPIIAQLAEEAGFEPGALDLLKRLGLTSEADLRAKLGIKETLPPSPSASANGGDNSGASESPAATPRTAAGSPEAPQQAGTAAGTTDPSTTASRSGTAASGASPAQPAKIPDPTVTGSGRPDSPPPQPQPNASGDHTSPQPQPSGGTSPPSQPGEPQGTGQQDTPAQPPTESSRRLFISFVAVEHDEPATDPDGLEQAARMALEDAAIAFILEQEPDWQRTPAGNPGYDLVKPAIGVAPCTWCEVKAMSGSLVDRPVAISRTQFEFAQSKGTSAWLYIVERAGGAQANIVRIRDPAGQARSFTFDHGWRTVAVTAGSTA
jgi:hypothetical protein